MYHISHRKQPRRRESYPAGFTLVELLVVIGVLIILTLMTVTMVNVTQNEDRIRAGAAQVQSYLEGARDRAIHAGEPRGVRFLPDANNPNVATTLIYIGAPTVFGDPELDQKRYLTPRLYQYPMSTQTEIYLESPDITRQGTDQTQWENFFRRGLIVPGESILQIEKRPYTFLRKNLPNVGIRYVVTTRDGISSLLNQQVQYFLHLEPSVLPNQEPRQLPRGVVINLPASIHPPSWGNSAAGYGTMDILFNPEGTVTGVEAASGVIHLVLADQVDVDLNFNVGVYQFDPDVDVPNNTNGPEDPITRVSDERIVSVRTQTGTISVHNVDPTDSDLGFFTSNNVADDPFKFAARGDSVQ